LNIVYEETPSVNNFAFLNDNDTIKKIFARKNFFAREKKFLRKEKKI